MEIYQHNGSIFWIHVGTSYSSNLVTSRYITMKIESPPVTSLGNFATYLLLRPCSCPVLFKANNKDLRVKEYMRLFKGDMPCLHGAWSSDR